MTYTEARAQEDNAPPRWSEHPPGVLRAFGWYVRQAIEDLCRQAEQGKVPTYRGVP